jgi:hypothetical protein
VAMDTDKDRQASALPAAYRELYDLAIMLGADEHPLLKLGIGPAGEGVPAPPKGSPQAP